MLLLPFSYRQVCDVLRPRRLATLTEAAKPKAPHTIYLGPGLSTIMVYVYKYMYIYKYVYITSIYYMPHMYRESEKSKSPLKSSKLKGKWRGAAVYQTRCFIDLRLHSRYTLHAQWVQVPLQYIGPKVGTLELL